MPPNWLERSIATDEIINLTASHLKISVWTVNDVERAKHLQQLGIQGLITDVPTNMLNNLSL
jgi:glycerophosphoryl diester phosphodiesterase